MIKSYYEFLIESILQVSDDFVEILNEMESEIATQFKNLINKDIKTKYNLLKLGEEISKVKFVRDSKSKLNNPDDIEANEINVGKLIQSILHDNGIVVSNKDLEEFVDEFKYLMFIKTTKLSIKVVEGEEIRKWYHVSNYADTRRGMLGKSCMMYSQCQKYFDIYVKNPEAIKMVIMLDVNDKLRARALLWKTNMGFYLDRTYYTDNYERKIIKNWVESNISPDFKNFPIDTKEDIYVKLINKTTKDGKYAHYPFLDTFKYYIPEKGILFSEGIFNSKYFSDNNLHNYTLYCLEDSEGGYRRYSIKDDIEDIDLTFRSYTNWDTGPL